MVVHIRKISDFGTSEPWVARVWVGVLRFRDMVYFGDEQRLAFDQKFAPVIDNLRECFQAMRLLHKAIADHEAKILAQEVNQGAISTESIDNTIRECFTNFFIKGNIAINNLCSLSKFMGCHIGFLRQPDDDKFEANAKKLLIQSPAAEALLRIIRKDRTDWFLKFLRLRGEIEHDSYQMPTVTYILKSNKLHPQFPEIDKMRLVDFTEQLWQSLFTFVEDILVHLFLPKLPPQIAIRIIPEKERDPLLPIKYEPCLDLSSLPPARD